MKEEMFYYCNNCDNSFASKNKVVRCPICNSNISELEKSNDYSSYYFGTFKKGINVAREEYKKKIIHPFIPLAFKKKDVLDRMRKVYLPCYFLNSHVDGSILFYGKNNKNSEEYKNLVKVNIDYRNEFISLNKLISSYVINQISDTFQYEKYNPNIIGDSIILDGNVDNEKDIDKYHEDIINASIIKSKENVPHKLKKIVEKKLNVNDTSKSIVYLPVYFTCVNYMKKKYYFIMNGEDGRVYCDIVHSKKISFIFGIVLFILISLIIYFIIRVI